MYEGGRGPRFEKALRESKEFGKKSSRTPLHLSEKGGRAVEEAGGKVFNKSGVCANTDKNLHGGDGITGQHYGRS